MDNYLNLIRPQNLRANPNSHYSLLINQMNSVKTKELQPISETDLELLPDDSKEMFGSTQSQNEDV